MAQRPADHRRTYGYLRLEILAALVNGVVLAALSAWIIFEAIRRFRTPHVIEGPLFAGVALAGLVVNLVALRLLKHDSHGNLNTRAAYLHVMGDLLGSVGALLAALIVIFTGWTLADPIVSVLISLLIIAGSWRLLRESVEILLEAAPSHIPLQDVERRMRGVEGVIAVHDLHVWTLTSGVVAMSGHVVVPDLASHPRGCSPPCPARCGTSGSGTSPSRSSAWTSACPTPRDPWPGERAAPAGRTPTDTPIRTSLELAVGAALPEGSGALLRCRPSQSIYAPLRPRSGPQRW